MLRGQSGMEAQAQVFSQPHLGVGGPKAVAERIARAAAKDAPRTASGTVSLRGLAARPSPRGLSARFHHLM